MDTHWQKPRGDLPILKGKNNSVYTYPGYESLNTTVDWEIPVAKVLPSPNVMYSTTSSYYTDRVIFTGGGGGFSRQYLTFDVNDGGTLYAQTFMFLS